MRNLSTRPRIEHPSIRFFRTFDIHIYSDYQIVLATQINSRIVRYLDPITSVERLSSVFDYDVHLMWHALDSNNLVHSGLNEPSDDTSVSPGHCVCAITHDNDESVAPFGI